ncbi:hypothetical protein MCHUDSM44219_02758 [Mycolicibacterium chubuense]|jgi:hypothetical protein|uniref:Uncharacterized protein n=1 Tax=Mycolicibacterium chubuense TaxID=1800 RepID=A0A0J6Z3J5_MYCCU|nr:hypothetical protein MCHUDSM44219_02758 [Mycolicibacterium chubuense]SPX99600.1 Uncharacterised protein [Mycolicibacterium chubuense]
MTTVTLPSAAPTATIDDEALEALILDAFWVGDE